MRSAAYAWTFLIAALAVLSMSAPAHAATSSQAVTVRQPRPFGYVLGDVMTQRVLLEVDGRELVPVGLPEADRQLGGYLERRAARIDTDARGRRWLVVDYQVMNAPQELTMTTIPAWQVESADGGPPLRVDEWPISVAPLTPRAAFGEGRLLPLQPDRPAPPVDTEPIRSRLAAWLGALVLVLAGWLGWWTWRNWQAASRRPFARAARELRRLDESSPKAWQRLHRAFDETAGATVRAGNLTVLFERAPHLNPLRPTIEQFFAQSRQQFFGAGLHETPLSVRALCVRLRQLEKRYER